jgi:hypothetical protein
MEPSLQKIRLLLSSRPTGKTCVVLLRPEGHMGLTSLKERLADPQYLDRHLLAVSLLQQARPIPWYDAHFLRCHETARKFLAIVEPGRLEEFEAGFAPIRTPPDFDVKSLSDVFTPAVREDIRRVVSELEADELETHEIGSFGRHVVHDHPYFLELQKQLLPRMSEVVGVELETGYNFLSLYGSAGRCDPHMDEPISMYTLDYCIDQQGDWPIHFSKVVGWPDEGMMRDWDPQALVADPDMEFRSVIIQPGEAIMFAGSGQWHYRDDIPPGGFCNLLFFHYFPAGCHDLVRPWRWAGHFGMVELEPLCDLFASQYRESGVAD